MNTTQVLASECHSRCLLIHLPRTSVRALVVRYEVPGSNRGKHARYELLIIMNRRETSVRAFLYNPYKFVCICNQLAEMSLEREQIWLNSTVLTVSAQTRLTDHKARRHFFRLYT